MATFTAAQLADARQQLAARPAGVTKTEINEALQAIETYMVGHAGEISAAIDAATAPFTFTAAQKKQLVAVWAYLRFEADK